MEDDDPIHEGDWVRLVPDWAGGKVVQVTRVVESGVYVRRRNGPPCGFWCWGNIAHASAVDQLAQLIPAEPSG